jgi:hypothetical protein
MFIGYARVSTHEQTLDLQQDALTKAGCTKIFTDTASGAKTERIGLDEALNYVRKGDTLVVWRLDRLGRSLPHLIATMTDLEQRGIGFKPAFPIWCKSALRQIVNISVLIVYIQANPKGMGYNCAMISPNMEE